MPLVANDNTNTSMSATAVRSSGRQAPSAGNSTLFPQDKCLFCDKRLKHNSSSHIKERLVKCVTEFGESSIKEAARAKNDYKMLGCVEGVNLIAKEARYHESCRRKYVRRADRFHHSTSVDEGHMVEKKSANDSAFKFICRHVETEIVDSGKVERMSMLRNRYVQYMQDNHPQFHNPNYVTHKLKSKLIAKFGDKINFWLPKAANKSELVFASNIDIGEAIEAAF
jgi:hypothetical protein